MVDIFLKSELQQFNWLSTITLISYYFDNQLIGLSKFEGTIKISDSSFLYVNKFLVYFLLRDTTEYPLVVDLTKHFRTSSWALINVFSYIL